MSSADPLMPFRALAYVVRIWEAWLRENEGATRLPPVIPVLLAQVGGGWSAPTTLAEVIDFADDAEREAIGPLVPSLRLVIDDLAHLSDAAIDGRFRLAVAKLCLAALRDVRSETEPETLPARWAEWIRASRRETNASARVTWVRYILHVHSGVDIQRLAENVRAIDPEGAEAAMTTARELVERGFAKGKAEGRAETLLKLLRLRFGAVPTAIAERVMHADIATLDRWVERVLTAGTLDEVLAD